MESTLSHRYFGNVQVCVSLKFLPSSMIFFLRYHILSFSHTVHWYTHSEYMKESREQFTRLSLYIQRSMHDVVLLSLSIHEIVVCRCEFCFPIVFFHEYDFYYCCFGVDTCVLTFFLLFFFVCVLFASFDFFPPLVSC